jgi:ribosomal protein L11 methyltransferase
MSRHPLWQITVTCSAPAETRVAAMLEDFFLTPSCSYTPAEMPQPEVSVFMAMPADLLKRSLVDFTRSFIKGCQQKPRLTFKRVRREDWAESWKKHFHPIRIGKTLLIKPSWDKSRPRPGQKTVILDPGLSFGTGQHPTTRFCLHQLAAHGQRHPGHSFLDIGCGSGILSIAAAKLGYAPVRALDHDPDAIRIARANGARNRVARRICLQQADLTKLPLKSGQQFDLICANLTADLLIAARQRITNRLQPAGALVLAGILTAQFPAVQSAYEALGFKLCRARRQQEWQSGLFYRLSTP